VAARISGRWSSRAAAGDSASRQELLLLAAAATLGFVITLVYVIATRHLPLAGDEIEYNLEGTLISHGHWFWTTSPYGILHDGAWKAPGYPAWVGIWYSILGGGAHPFAVRLVQTPLAPITVVLAWVLTRRLFGPRVATVTAFVVALYPMAWQYLGLLYPEALAIPLYLGLCIVLLTRPPTLRRAIGFGLLLGVTLLVRPSCVYVFLPTLVVWSIMAGWRRGIGLTVVAILASAVVIAPWTIRNAIVLHGFVPISLESAAAYGTFNSQSASNSQFPYAWEPDPKPDAYLFNPHHPLPDATLNSRLERAALDYIKAHPSSVPKAFFWNGIVRFWDLRSHSKSLVEVPFEGRSRVVSQIALWAYDVLAVLAVVGLWRARRKRWLVAGLLAMALGASIVFTTDSGTRYRAPMEPLIAMLACVGVLGAGEGMVWRPRQ
jgi:4-amino-4-deoxy-L-arabinose transferase-like glycosyltransferase